MTMSDAKNKTGTPASTSLKTWASDRCAVFRRDESGSLVIFTLFLIVVMLMVGGIAVDVIRHETKRSQIQYSLDRGALAAADLQQTLGATKTVKSYMRAVGLKPKDYNVVVNKQEGLNFRKVTATAGQYVPTHFMNLFGIDRIPVTGRGVAEERIMDIEISLVLDVSGSMNSNNRLTLMKDAARDFIDSVIPDGATEEKVSISIIPFSTQVNAGPDLLSFYNATSEHGYSHCVDFATSDFSTAALPTTQSIQRTGHFDPWGTRRPPNAGDFVCHPDTHRHIVAWSHDPVVLKAAITNLVAGGNTSMDIGAKWGSALLDPSARSIVTSKVNSNNVHADFAGRPFDYDEENTMKVMVVMSDGQNTSQYYLRDSYKNGLSHSWLDVNGAGISDDDWSQYDPGYNDYYHYDNNRYYSYPDGGSSAVRQTYPQVWNQMSVKWWASRLKTKASGGSTNGWASAVYTSHGGTTKNSRTSSICGAAKTAGVLVFSIGMETYGQGDATLLDCASSASHFFDVDGIEISEAFNAIAAKINQLKLVQ